MVQSRGVEFPKPTAAPLITDTDCAEYCLSCIIMGWLPGWTIMMGSIAYGRFVGPPPLYRCNLLRRLSTRVYLFVPEDKLFARQWPCTEGAARAGVVCLGRIRDMLAHTVPRSSRGKSHVPASTHGHAAFSTWVMAFTRRES
eukprot:1733507-Prymnesium_polylepis.1